MMSSHSSQNNVMAKKEDDSSNDYDMSSIDRLFDEQLIYFFLIFSFYSFIDRMAKRAYHII